MGLSGRLWACLDMSGPLWTPISQPAPQPASEAHNRLVLCTLGVTYIRTYILGGVFHIERPTEAQRGLKRRPREARRGSHRPREAQRRPEKLRAPRRGTETHREAQSDSERPKEAQGGLHTYIHMYTHKSIETPREAERG